MSFTRRELPLLLSLSLGVLLLIAACGGGDENGDADPTILTPVSGDFIPTVISSDIAVGENRLVMGLLDADQLPIAGADLQAEFLRVEDDGSTTSTAEVSFAAITIERSFTHLHENDETHRHEVGELGVYITNIAFDTPGRWQVVTSGTVGDQQMEPTPFLFDVREAPLSPAIGAPAPKSVQLIIDDVENLDLIDTSLVPNVEMHSAPARSADP
jgi:hypothetical protein